MRTLAVALLLTSLLLGCQPKRDASSATQAKKFEYQKVVRNGVRITLPKHWVVLDPSGPDFNRATHDLEGENERLRPLMSMTRIMAAGGSFRLFAFDLNDDATDISGNMNVTCNPVPPGKTPEELFATGRTLLKAIGGTVEEKDVQFGGQTYHRMNFKSEMPGLDVENLETFSYITFRGNYQINVTVALFKMDGIDVVQTADAIVATCKIQ